MENTFKTDISGKWVYLQYHEEAVKEAYEQGRKDALKEALEATLLSKLTSCAG